MSEVEKLRWLADARAEYVSGPFETVNGYFALPDAERAIAREVLAARQLADILEGVNDGCGWLPSWKWDDWEEIK